MALAVAVAQSHSLTLRSRDFGRELRRFFEIQAEASGGLGPGGETAGRNGCRIPPDVAGHGVGLDSAYAAHFGVRRSDRIAAEISRLKRCCIRGTMCAECALAVETSWSLPAKAAFETCSTPFAPKLKCGRVGLVGENIGDAVKFRLHGACRAVCRTSTRVWGLVRWRRNRPSL